MTDIISQVVQPAALDSWHHGGVVVFAIAGHFNGEPASVTWDDGKLQSSNELLLFFAELEFRKMAGTSVGPVAGPYRTRDHINDGLSSLIILSSVFDPLAEKQYSGDVPWAEVVPGVVH